MTSKKPLQFRNVNTLWAFILVETLQRLGVKTAIICPGSRSAPLAVAFAQDPEVEAIPLLDERSASFFALGIAQRSRFPVALVCTSGTAAANFYPAVIEASISRIPLLILTADRPPELQNCHAGQTIDQLKLYGHYPNWQVNVAVPSGKLQMLQYLRQMLIQSVRRTLHPIPGPVHLNLPFSEPLAPIPQTDIEAINSQLKLDHFFDGISTLSSNRDHATTQMTPLPEWDTPEGIIIAGVAQSQNPWGYCRAIARLSEALGWPVLAEALSPVRNYAGLNPYLISTYDLILRNPALATRLTPKIVIQVGDFPTSKELRIWLENTQPQRWILDSSYENLDPLHGTTTHLPISIEQIVFPHTNREAELAKQDSPYLRQWCEADAKVRDAIQQAMQATETFLEGKVAWLLSQTLPAATPVFIANSMSVRNAEFFWSPRNSGIRPYFNRGANGIDGTLSTALGIAHHNQSSILLTGDLSLLHDINGFLQKKYFVGHLTIVLINNNGGGIFEMLPISEFDPPFEEFFATPQNIHFSELAKAYQIEYHLINSWDHFIQFLNPLPTTGIRILEISTDRKADAHWLQTHLGKFASF